MQTLSSDQALPCRH